MEPAKPQVASRWNIGACPNDISMKSRESLRPMSPSADRALKLKLVSFKENLLMCANMTWNFLAIQRGEDRIADTYGLAGLDRSCRQMPPKAVPVPVVDAN
jgi:hypothetical protein